MFDFFDEDFPLSKKQEEEYKKRLGVEMAEKAEGLPFEEAPVPSEPIAEQESVGSIVINTPDAGADDIYIEPITGIETVYPDDDDYDDGYDDEFYDETVVKDAPAATVATEPKPAAVAEPEPIDEAESVAELEPIVEVEPVHAAEAEPMSEPITKPVAEAAEEPEPEPAPEPVPEPASEPVPLPDTEEVLERKPEPVEVTADSSVGFEIPHREEDDNLPKVEEIGRRIASLDEIEAHLHEELRSLGEKLDSMEKVVDGMEDGEIAEGFNYEYDERYFAEEETPAYRHPELYDKKETKAAKNPPVTVHKAPKKSGEIILDTGKLLKIGAVFAAAAVAVSLLGGKDKKK